MILQCSQCKYRYRVEDRLIGPQGRTVRCAHCKHSWFQEALTPQESLASMERMLQELSAQPKPRPRPVSPGTNLPVPRPEVPLGLKIGAFSMTAVAACLTLLFFMPFLFGFSSTQGLKLSDVSLATLEKTENGRPVYAISGKIVNSESRPLAIPVMRITLVDHDGNTLQPWEDSSAKGQILQPGEEIPFNFDDLAIKFSKGARFVVDLGNPLELALRRKP